MKTPDTVKSRLLSWYGKNRTLLLKAEAVHDRGEFPVFTLSPSKTEAQEDIAGFTHFLKAWRSVEGGEVQWEKVTWHGVGGELEIPRRLTFASVKGILTFIGDEKLLKDWTDTVFRLRSLEGKNSEALKTVLLGETEMLDSAAETERFCACAEYLASHRPLDCFIRELPIEGVDTKWLERHKGALAKFLSLVFKEEIRAKDLEEKWGFRTKPVFVTVRHADIFIEGFSPEDTAALTPEVLNRKAPGSLWIIENLQTGLAVRAPKNTAVFMGLGFGVDKLRNLTWLTKVPVFYMGDLDVHGLLILAKLREIVPKAVSVLMDSGVLEKFERLAVADPTDPKVSVPPIGLSEKEAELFGILRQNRLRLEQERIPVVLIEEAFYRAAQGSPTA